MSVSANILQGIPTPLRQELMAEYKDMVRNYRENRWGVSELNGAKFCEVVYTIIRGYTDNSYPNSASKPRNFLHACRDLEKSDPTSVPHSFRILIPRLLPGLYDIRNNRGVGHVGGDVDPNRMDATVVFEMARWILAELARVYQGVPVDEAQIIVDGLIDRIVPIAWELPDGRIRVLDVSLSMRQRMLVMLYKVHPDSMSETELVRNMEHVSASTFRRDVLRPAHKKAYIHYDEEQRLVYISPIGIREVEENIDLQV